MDVPTSAIEAAAEALHGHLPESWGSLNDEPVGIQQHRVILARAALSAAMPAIREALAQEIEGHAGWTPTQPPWWAVAMENAARIVRGGTE